MNRLLKIILLITSVIVLQACDPYSQGFICNDTQAPLELTLILDYKEHDHWTKEQYMSWQSEDFDSNLILLQFDTASMVGTYKIENGKCALVGHGVEAYPPMSFDSMEIRTRNKTLTYSNIKNKRIFIKRDEGFKIGFGGNFEFRVSKDTKEEN